MRKVLKRFLKEPNPRLQSNEVLPHTAYTFPRKRKVRDLPVTLGARNKPDWSGGILLSSGS